MGNIVTAHGDIDLQPWRGAIAQDFDDLGNRLAPLTGILGYLCNDKLAVLRIAGLSDRELESHEPPACYREPEFQIPIHGSSDPLSARNDASVSRRPCLRGGRGYRSRSAGEHLIAIE